MYRICNCGCGRQLSAMDCDCPPTLPPIAQEVITILKAAAKLTGFSPRTLLSKEIIHNVQPWRYAIFTILAANGHSTTQIGEAFGRHGHQIQHAIKPSASTARIKEITYLLRTYLLTSTPDAIASLEAAADVLMTPPLRKVRTS